MNWNSRILLLFFSVCNISEHTTGRKSPALLYLLITASISSSQNSETVSYFQLYYSWNLNYTVLTKNPITWGQQTESTTIKKKKANKTNNPQSLLSSADILHQFSPPLPHNPNWLPSVKALTNNHSLHLPKHKPNKTRRLQRATSMQRDSYCISLSD